MSNDLDMLPSIKVAYAKIRFEYRMSKTCLLLSLNVKIVVENVNDLDIDLGIDI